MGDTKPRISVRGFVLFWGMLEVLEKAEPYLAALGAALLILTPIVQGLEAAAARYVEHAERTSDPGDDHRAAAVQGAVAKVVVAVAWVTKFLPRLTRGAK